MKKKNTVLVFGITSNYLFALANTLLGLVEKNKKFWDDIIVYYDTLEDSDIENINKITECRFIKFADMPYLKTLSKDVLEKYSSACFYRYECFNLLNEYKTVIWNDVDILITGDISGLTKYGEKSGFAATLTTAGFKNEANFQKLILDYNMFTPLYNSGILVLQDTLKDYEKMCDWCVAKTVEYSDILRWPDQGIINILIQEFEIEADLIDVTKYCCHPSQNEYIPNASIIHAYGDEKFWSSEHLKKKFPDWEKYDKKWRRISQPVLKSKEFPLVSCIMSTYNRYDYLKESVDSILNQTYKNIELIVVLEKCDNQGKIEQILRDYNDDRIVIIKNKEKLGFPLSLNVAMDAAKGKYIARMDDDDISLPTRFEKQVAFMENNPEFGICGTNAVFFGKYNSEIGAITDPDILKVNTLFKTPFIHPTVMMNAELINKNKLRYDKDYFTEDYEFWSRAVECFPITNLDEVLLKYRTGSDNMTAGKNEKHIHNSHKRIMRNQLKNYLFLDVNENEIELLQGRLNHFEICFNYDAAIEIKKNLCKKIIEANAKLNFYNQSKLESILGGDEFGITAGNKQSFIKRIVKKLLKPIYGRLMNRVDNLINLHDYRIYNYVDKRIEEIKNDQKK